MSGLFVVGTATSAQAKDGSGPGHEGKVTICHRGSDSNEKWTSVSVDTTSIESPSGHAVTDPYDIIPPFEGFAGLNWDAQGQAIYAQDCSTVVAVPEKPPVTPATCESPGAFSLPADTVALDWGISPAYDGPGSYTVTVAAVEPFEFKKPKVGTISWTIVVPNQLSGPGCEGGGDPVPQEIGIPAEPQVDEPTCTADGRFTLPADTAQLDWSEVSRVATADGWTVTVRVEPQEGFAFADAKPYEEFAIEVLKQLDADDPTCAGGSAYPRTWETTSTKVTCATQTITTVTTSWSRESEEAAELVTGEQESSRVATAAELASAGCAQSATGSPPVVTPDPAPVKPGKPAVVVSSTTEDDVDCDLETVVTTMVTTTTDWVYDAATNSWVPGTPAVVETVDSRETAADDCPDAAPVEGEQPAPGKPAEPSKPAQPVVEPDEVEGVDAPKPRVEPVVAARPAAVPAAVPTAVDAGLGPVAETPQGSPLGQGLVGGGLVMLLLAGSMRMGRRERGAHEA